MQFNGWYMAGSSCIYDGRVGRDSNGSFYVEKAETGRQLEGERASRDICSS